MATVTETTRRLTHDDAVAIAVVDAVAEASETPATGLEFELNEYVDPDALERLFAPRIDGTTRPGGHLRFEVDGHPVVVAADGREVVVRVESTA
jgi:hypothetical protein